MVYDMMIGEKVLQSGEGTVNVSVTRVEHPDAPNCLPLTGKRNFRSAPYLGWEEFAEQVNLSDLLLPAGDRGHVELEQQHLDQVVAARTAYVDKTHYNYTDRLAWLEFWMQWALTNCNNPIFKIS